MKREEIEARVLAQIRRGVDVPPDEESFDGLARALFDHQYRHGEAYRRLCRAEGLSPDTLRHWTEIPAVPTEAFKLARLASFPAERTRRVFRTSGTTGGRRGELHLDTLAVYEASLLETFRAYICPGREKPRFLVLAPSAAQAPDSSLSYMYDFAARRLGADEPRFYVDAQGWQPERLLGDLEALSGPAAVVGTAFAFVHLAERLAAEGRRLELPEGSRAMETGGFKGRSRELEREALHGLISQSLGVPPERIVNQYGMCELGSQFYEPSLRCGIVTRVKRIPPWVRTRVIDPVTRNDAPEGEVGVLVHYDLANTGSVLAVETADAGRRIGDGFEVLGRWTGAEPRGCSIAADALLDPT